MADLTPAESRAPAQAAATPSAPRQPHRRLPRALILVCVLALIAGAYEWRRSANPALHYTTVAASRGTVAPAVTSSGAVNPVTTVQVGTYVSGVIETILCDFNTEVRAGRLCAKIDSRPYQTIVEQEAAALGTAKAQMEKDRINLSFAKVVDQRNADLLRRGIVSQETADTSHNTALQAQGQLALDAALVAQHEAQLKAARINLGYTNIVSPVDGTVVSRNVTQGQTVAASFQTPTLFLIATDLTKMQVDTNVSESDIGRVAVGNQAIFTVASYPERQFIGKVEQVRQAPQTVQNVVTYDVVVGVANPDLALRPGMTASIRIVTQRADGVLRVPDQALRYRPIGTQGTMGRGQGGAPQGDGPQGDANRRGRPGHVWVLQDGRPRQLAVMIGLEDDSNAEIAAGDLRAGQQVIVGETAETPRASAAAPGLSPPRR